MKLLIPLLSLAITAVASEKWADKGIALNDLGLHEDPQGGGAYLWSVDANVNGDEIWKRHLDTVYNKYQGDKQMAQVQAMKDGWANMTQHDGKELQPRQQQNKNFWKDGSYDSWYCERWADPRSGAGSCSWQHNFVEFGKMVGNDTRLREIIRALIYRAIDHGYPGLPSHGFHSECLYYQDGPLFCISWPVYDNYYDGWGGKDWIRRYTVDHFTPQFIDVLARLATYCNSEKSSAQIFTTDRRKEIWIMCFSDRHTGCDTMVCHPFFGVQPIDFTKWEWPEGDTCPDSSLEDWPQCKQTAPKDPDSQHNVVSYKAPIGALREFQPTYRRMV